MKTFDDKDIELLEKLKPQTETIYWAPLEQYLVENNFDFEDSEWAEIKNKIKDMCAQTQKKHRNDVPLGIREKAKMDKFFSQKMGEPDFVMNRIREQKDKLDSKITMEFIEEAIEEQRKNTV